MVQINAAESNRAQIRVIKEAVWGTTPTSGITKQVRLTSSGLEASKDTKTSDEIRADRMVSNIIEVAASSSGPIEFEFSAGSMDDFLEAFVLGAWTEPLNYWMVKGSSVAVTDTNTITISGEDYTNYITVGQYVKLEGFLDDANNGYFEVSAKAFGAGNTTIDVVGTPLIAEAGSAFTKVMDAGDVLVAATTVTFTASNTLDGGGANGFGTVKAGQKIYIEGLGKETGTVQFDLTDPPEGSTVTVGDGVNESLTFEFRTVAGLVDEANIYVALSGTPATQAASLALAVQQAFRERKFEISATAATDTVTFVNHKRTGGVLTASDAGSTNVTAFAGGSATKGGFYTVASVIDNDTLTTTETLTADANAGTLKVVVKGSHLRNPGVIGDITKQSFSVETGFTDVSKYFLMNGMRPGSFSLNVEAGELVSGSIEFMGRETTRSSTETLGNTATYTVLDSTVTEVLNATSNVGTITKDGVALELAIKAIEMNGDANLREQRAVGSKFPAGIGYGRFTLEGSFMAYFEDFSQYDVFINHTTTSLSFPFTDVDSNTYYFTIPAIKYKSDPIKPEGIDQDVMEEIEWEAQRDPVLKTQLMVDRFSSVWPMTA